MIPVEITTAAASHLIKMIQRDGKKNIILAIVPGGCNGFEYKWEITDGALDQDGDVGIRLSSENILYLSKDTAAKMYASIISIKDDGLSKKLDILNPNVAYSCGCGESVNFK